MGFDQAQSPRIGQKTAVESTYVRMFAGTEIPEAAWPGQVIFRTDTQILQVYSELGGWLDVVGGEAGLLTYVGPSVPIAHAEGDIWFDTDNGYAMYVALIAGADTISDTEWVLTQDSAAASAAAADAMNQASKDITSDRLEQVLVLENQIIAGDVTLDSNGLTVLNDDDSATTIRGNESHLAGTAELNETRIQGGLSINYLDNYLNGTMVLSEGFAEPTARPSVSNNRKAVKVVEDYGFERRGLSELNSTAWMTTDTAAGNSNVQCWQKDGSGFSFFSIVANGYTLDGGVVRVPGSPDKIFTLGRWGSHNDEWWLRRYSMAGALELNWQIGGYNSAQQCALGYNAVNGYLVIYRIGSGGNSVIERWNTDSTSAGAGITGPTWDVEPTGIIYGDAGGTFAANRWVFASRTNGVRVYNTSMARVTSEEWTHGSSTCRGIYHDGNVFYEFNGSTVTEYSKEPGGSKDFAFAYVDNDTAGIGTATSLPGNRLTVAVPRYTFTTVSVPKPPDQGGVDDPNTIAIYCGAVGGTLYRQSVLPTNGIGGVGGVPTTYAQTYPIALSSTATPAVSLSGFAGRTAPASGAFESAHPASGGGPMLAVRGDGSWKLGEAAGDINGKMLTNTISVTISDAAYTGNIDLFKVAGIVYCIVNVSRASSFNNSFHTIGTIPTGWRPTTSITAPAQVCYSTTHIAYSFSFSSAGVISLRETAAPTSAMLHVASWPCS